MTLILTNEDAAQVLTMAGTIEALEQLYGDLGRGSAVYRGRTDLFTPTKGAADDLPPAASGTSFPATGSPRRSPADPRGLGVADVKISSPSRPAEGARGSQNYDDPRQLTAEGGRWAEPVTPGVCTGYTAMIASGG